MLEYIGWREAAEMIRAAYEKTVSQKVVTYDFARQMDGATEVKTSEFATALINNL
jgi:isocitrate dehydrogenase